MIPGEIWIRRPGLVLHGRDIVEEEVLCCFVSTIYPGRTGIQRVEIPQQFRVFLELLHPGVHQLVRGGGLLRLGEGVKAAREDAQRHDHPEEQYDHRYQHLDEGETDRMSCALSRHRTPPCGEYRYGGVQKYAGCPPMSFSERVR
ncbi:MAG: hypothetical protein BWY76_03227 [bacterium ADurb.Bin429]|nr:MAG: hypothetical protein BWY76_03227 [bacterium ADurb.Bin429]